MNSQSNTACGGWESPVSAEQVATASSRLSEVQLRGRCVYWLEQLADENGRTTIMRCCDNKKQDLLQKDFNCRCRVHEYGGGAYAVADEAIFFVNDADQQVYCLDAGGTPRKLTARKHCRYADLAPAGEHLLAIEEDHAETGAPPANRLVCIDRHGEVVCLSGTHDFYASPRYYAQTQQLTWLCWNHPHMPWQSTELMLGYFKQGRLQHSRRIAGGDGVSIFQPQFFNDWLYYVSDESGWWNLYRQRDGVIEAVLPMQAEFGLPQWVFAQSTYCFHRDKLIACCNQNGRQHLLEIDTQSLQSRRIASDNIQFEYLRGNTDGFACIAASAWQGPRVLLYRDDNVQCLSDDVQTHALKRDDISIAQALTIRSRHGDDIHANYYPPVNAHYQCTEPPPLIVLGHGGPTAQASAAFDIKKQFWTSRGFALLDVNYSGSTGYGRAYQNRLNGQWGVRDVHDVCDAAREIVHLGLAHAEKLIIKGSSAGGYTVLAALTFESVFHAGASYYGISNLATLLADTHKFEAHYLDSLVGPYPQQQALYHQRSPIHHVSQINCPVIFLQGDEDKVVPKSQAEHMVAALNAKNIAVSYLLFHGEQHGFRRRQTIIDALQAELCFYRRILNLGGTDCALEIRNFPSPQ